MINEEAMKHLIAEAKDQRIADLERQLAAMKPVVDAAVEFEEATATGFFNSRYCAASAGLRCACKKYEARNPK